MQGDKILIIYHDWGLTESCKNLLEDEGFTDVRTALTTEEGLAAARRFKPDLLILAGLHMPAAKDGLAFCRFLHSLPEIKTTKLMVVTGHFLQEYITELLCSGVSICIGKPCSPQEFIATVKDALSEANM